MNSNTFEGEAMSAKDWGSVRVSYVPAEVRRSDVRNRPFGDSTTEGRLPPTTDGDPDVPAWVTAK